MASGLRHTDPGVQPTTRRDEQRDERQAHRALGNLTYGRIPLERRLHRDRDGARGAGRSPRSSPSRPSAARVPRNRRRHRQEHRVGRRHEPTVHHDRALSAVRPRRVGVFRPAAISRREQILAPEDSVAKPFSGALVQGNPFVDFRRVGRVEVDGQPNLLHRQIQLPG